jgi:hypothetical protein
MRCVAHDERVAIFDDFLAPADHARVWRFVQAQRYLGFHASGWDGVWPLHDGEPRVGPVENAALLETVLPEAPGPSIAKTHDLNMLVLTGGRERTLAEYRDLLRAAGLTLTRHIPATAGTPDVLEAEGEAATSSGAAG